MNYKKILSSIAISSILFTSCDDQIMEWGKDASHGEVTVAELPLELAEKISRYDALRTYTDFTLGVGAGLSLYMEDETYRSLVNENFDEITVGYDMKHGALVASDGHIQFEKVDPFIETAKAAGMKVFGHTLVWHSNQNVSYLNGLLAATVIPGSAGSNLLSDGDFNENIDAFGAHWGSGEFSLATAEEALDGEGALKIINTNNVASEQWKTQAQTTFPSILEAGKTYTISLYVRSEEAGSFRLSTTKAGDDGSIHYLADFATTSAWSNATFEIESDGYETGLSIDIGGVAGTYYFDKFEVVDKDAPVEIDNKLANGDFENGTIDSWSYWGSGEFSLATTDNAFDGEGAFKIINTNDDASQQWKTQAQTTFTSVLEAGKTYTISLYARSEDAGSFRFSTTKAGDDGSIHYLADATTTSAWSNFTFDIEADGYETGLSLDIGGVAGIYYMDNMVLSSGEALSSGPTIIEKTEEEKTQIIDDAMSSWISQMVTHYKSDVMAWDVVNEPMLENGAVRDGNVDDDTDDSFYWQKFLGKDYAVTAFKLARQYGNPTDILFINDYNLEYSVTKLEGLISYVQYIESKGATIDGIGTQMHISLTSDTALMVAMFQKLAATGKLIKISELDVRLGTAAPTAAQLSEQAEMYQFVVDAFRKYVPESQQYGITIWGVSDNEQEHEYWLPEESPNLWDANYERKQSYKGVADGLAGRDVSEDFSGELEPSAPAEEADGEN